MSLESQKPTTYPSSLTLALSHWEKQVLISRQNILGEKPPNAYHPPDITPTSHGYSLIYNPSRKGRLSGVSPANRFTVHPPDLPDPIFTTKLSTDEILKQFAEERYQAIINLFPILFGNSLLVSTELKPQLMDYEFLSFLVRFARANPELIVFYNSWGASATKNAQHAQILLAEVLNHGDPDSLLSRSLQFSVGQNPERSLNIIMYYIEAFQTGFAHLDNGTPFNILIFRDNFLLIPRKTTITSLEGRHFLPGHFSKDQEVAIGMPGVLELLKIFVITDPDVLSSFQRQTAEEIVQRCLLSAEELERIKTAIPQPS